MFSSTTNLKLISICTSCLFSACSVTPASAPAKKPAEGVAKVRAATEAAVASSDLEIAKDTPATRHQSTVQCDTVGNMYVCTDGQAICWWSRRTGYGCN